MACRGEIDSQSDRSRSSDTDDEIDDELAGFMIDYVPHNSGERDYDSQTLVYFKSGKVYDHTRRAKFEERIQIWCEKILRKYSKVVFAIAPGHSADSDGSQNFLYNILEKVIEKFPTRVIDGRTLLYRKLGVDKAAHGGRRSQSLHERTISVRHENEYILRDQIVLIFDDVWTTGCTLCACAKLVRTKKAKVVKLFAVGKTK